MIIKCPYCHNKVDAEFVSKQIVKVTDSYAQIYEKWKIPSHPDFFGDECVYGDVQVDLDLQEPQQEPEEKPKFSLLEYLEVMGV